MSLSCDGSVKGCSLLEHKADVNAKSEDNGTALIWGSYAVGSPKPGVIKALLASKADPHVVVTGGDYKGCTALALLAAAGHPGQAGVVALVEAGADPNVKDNEGTSPLHGQQRLRQGAGRPG